MRKSPASICCYYGRPYACSARGEGRWKPSAPGPWKRPQSPRCGLGSRALGSRSAVGASGRRAVGAPGSGPPAAGSERRSAGPRGPVLPGSPGRGGSSEARGAAGGAGARAPHGEQVGAVTLPRAAGALASARCAPARGRRGRAEGERKGRCPPDGAHQPQARLRPGEQLGLPALRSERSCVCDSDPRPTHSGGVSGEGGGRPRSQPATGAGIHPDGFAGVPADA